MKLRVRGVETHPVVVPLARPIRTASGAIGEAPLLLIDLLTDEGVAGHAYLFGYQPFTLAALDHLVRSLAESIEGDAVVPFELARKLRTRVALLGTRGLVGMALSGLDMAAWDAFACALGMPLVTALGGARRPTRAYLGNGIGVIPVGEIPETAAALADDVAAVRAARRALPDGIALMADFNQSLTVAEAIRRGQALDDEGLAWIEEPVRADDFSGCASVAAGVRTPVQIGENFCAAFEMDAALRARASDLVMADAQQIGGVTGWMSAASVAQTGGVPLSSHLFPEVSAHLMCVSPTADWLEYMNVADPVLAQPLAAVDGAITPSDRPGSGVTWDTGAVRRYRVP